MDEARTQRAGSTPNPDPTTLTTEALQREVQTAKETTALQVAHEQEMRRNEVVHIHEVIALQVAGITREMELVERNRVEQKTDALASLAAALTAQKELFREQGASSALAISKSENAAIEQMKTMNQTFNIAIESERRVSNDLKERVNLQEQMLATHSAAQIGEGKGKEQSWGLLVASVSGVGVIVGTIVTIVLLVTH